MANQSPSADVLRAAFDAAPEYTVGIEEEVMLLDPETLELTPRAREVLARLKGDPRFKPEMPASQIEILTAAHERLSDVVAELAAGRRALADSTRGEVKLAAAGVSPLGSGVGELNRLPRYEAIEREYGLVARRQLVCALQVHVAVGDAERALAVYNAARAYLPFVAALAANGAVYEGQDSGLASVRPTIGQLLPRQGLPPALDSWDDYAEALRWGMETETFTDPSSWWWELRLHPRLGTLEFRVPDSQATVADAAAVGALIQALVVWLAERARRGEKLQVAPSWQIAENRWSACRHGVEGWAIDPENGMRRSMGDALERLLTELSAIAESLRSGPALARAGEMVRVNGAMLQRQTMRESGARGVAQSLVERFLEPWAG